MYTAKDIDVQKFEDKLKAMRTAERDENILAKKEADAYFNGYEKCIYEVVDMLHCSNYEKKQEITVKGP